MLLLLLLLLILLERSPRVSLVLVILLGVTVMIHGSGRVEYLSCELLIASIVLALKLYFN